MSLPTLFAGKSAPGLSAALDLRFALDKSLTAYRGPTPSFSRASTGTFFNSSGVLTSAAINAPRFNHTFNGTSWVSKGLLVEEQRTALALYSEQFGNAVWAINAATISANVISAPDGNTTADKIQETASGGSTSPYINQSINYTSGNKYTLSCFVKAAERNYVVLGWYQNSTDYAAVFNLTDGTVSNTYGGATAGTATDIGGGWLRCAVTFNCTGSGAGSTIIGPRLTGAYANYSPTAGYGIYLWGAQVEAGSFPTSYIGTTNSSVVRSADVCQITGSDFSGFWNGAEGSIAIECDRIFTGSADNYLLNIQNATGTNTIYGEYYNGNIGFQVYYGAGTPPSVSFASSGAGISSKLAYGFSSSGYSGSKDGSAVTQRTTTQMGSGYDRFYIGYRGDGFYWNGHIARLRYFNKRLPNATLQLLSDPDPTLNLQFALNKSLTPVAGPAPSFSRASTGTYFNSSGVLTSASINTPRFDHVFSGGQWVSRGLLVEEQRTNLNLRSEEFDNAAYSKSQCAIVANQVAAPDGATTADKLTATSGTVNPYAYQAVTTANGSVYTFSIYVKKNTHDFVQILLNGVANGFANFDINNGVLGTLGAGGSATSSIVNVGNGWYRCVVTYTTASTVGNGVVNLIGSAAAGRSATFTAAGTESVYLWGQQLELGAFPTSYMGTTSSPVTRSADVCQITGTSFGWMWNQGEGSLFFDADSFSTSTNNQFITSASSGASSNSINLVRSNANDVTGVGSSVLVGGVVQEAMNAAAGTWPTGSSCKLSFGYKANDFAQSVNGTAVTTDTSGSIPTVSQMVIGDAGWTTGTLNGHIAKLIYYPARLTNTKLQQLST